MISPLEEIENWQALSEMEKRWLKEVPTPNVLHTKRTIYIRRFLGKADIIKSIESWGPTWLFVFLYHSWPMTVFLNIKS